MADPPPFHATRPQQGRAIIGAALADFVRIRRRIPLRPADKANPCGQSCTCRTAQAATVEPIAMITNATAQPMALRAPPNQSSATPTTTGPTKPVVNPAIA
jgi:hypothetical protein